MLGVAAPRSLPSWLRADGSCGPEAPANAADAAPLPAAPPPCLPSMVDAAARLHHDAVHSKRPRPGRASRPLVRGRALPAGDTRPLRAPAAARTAPTMPPRPAPVVEDAPPARRAASAPAAERPHARADRGRRAESLPTSTWTRSSPPAAMSPRSATPVADETPVRSERTRRARREPGRASPARRSSGARPGRADHRLRERANAGVVRNVEQHQRVQAELAGRARPAGPPGRADRRACAVSSSGPASRWAFPPEPLVGWKGCGRVGRASPSTLPRVALPVPPGRGAGLRRRLPAVPASSAGTAGLEHRPRRRAVPDRRQQRHEQLQPPGHDRPRSRRGRTSSASRPSTSAPSRKASPP